MRALSLWQPWASAIALDKKRIETRSWFTAYRGLVAIHAAKRPLHECVDPDAWIGLQSLLGGVDPRDLPRGCVVAMATLADCQSTNRLTPSKQEREWGDYSPGRYGWLLTEISALSEPVPLRGHQGLWELTESETADVLAKARGGSK